MKRILVTGSRTWTNQLVITEALWDAWIDLGRGPTTLVHGACKDGADKIADMVWATNQYPVERHPVTPEEWKRIGRGAGMIRNQVMVDRGADLCLAFIAPCTDPNCRRPKRVGPHGSHGASSCADMAERAGIETRRFAA